MYHVVGIGVTAILIYLISYFFCLTGYYTVQFHNKLWNSLLAAVFILTAIAGLFLALQVQYKWNLPFVKTVLKWHVEFGLGMAVAGTIHLIRHFPYYINLFRRSGQIIGKNYQEYAPQDFPTEGGQLMPNTETAMFHKTEYSGIRLNLFIIGFVSSSVQLLLLREIMNIAGGYELVSGTFLGSWLIGSAAGSLLAGRSGLKDIRKINLVFAISPLLSLILLLLLTRLFLNTGQSPTIFVSFIFTFLVLIPTCLASGFTFVKITGIAKAGNNIIPGKSFSIETTGGIAAGILISVLTSGILNTYQLLLAIILLTNAWVLLNFIIINPRNKFITKVLVVVFLSLIFFFNADIFFRQILLPGINITDTVDTPYGNITYGEYKGEKSTYYNQRLLTYNNDAAEREENIHYAMLQSENPKKVILISGSLRSNLPEILKYPVDSIFYIERDPALAVQENNIDSLKNKVVISSDDGFRFIRRSPEPFDVVLLLVPPPSTLLLNRYYTTEFFMAVKKKMNPGGIFMCSPGQAESYYNDESVGIYSSVYNSMKTVFKNVIPIAGNKLYLLASDKKLSSSICNLTEMRKISNIYVSPDFLSDDLIAGKSKEITTLLDASVKKNKSAFPVAYLNFQSYSFSKNKGEKIPSIIFLIVLFAFPVFAVKRRNFIMYTSASALAGFEIISLLSLQLIIGNMYQLTGLIISGLMAGLSVGAGVDSQKIKLSIRSKTLILFFYYILFALFFNRLMTLERGFPAGAVLLMLAFLPAMVTGNIFRELTVHEKGTEITPEIYSADLSGSAFGFVFLSVLAIPLFGIQISIFLLSFLIFAGFLFGTVINKY